MSGRIAGRVYVSVKGIELVEWSHTNNLLLPLLSCKSHKFVKENPDRKKNYEENKGNINISS